jgi:hypothetical protein
MESERSKKIAAHLTSLKARVNRLEDSNLQAIAEICEWQQEQIDEDGGVLARCEDWTAKVEVVVEEKFAEINKLIIHDREAFEVIFKNYFELKGQLDFLQRSLEVVEAAVGVDLEGERDRQGRGVTKARQVHCQTCDTMASRLLEGLASRLRGGVHDRISNEKLEGLMLAASGDQWEDQLGTLVCDELFAALVELIVFRELTKE